MAERFRVLELFAGIGGCAAAIGELADIVTAVETDQDALAIYRHNFSHPTCDQPVESLSTRWFRDRAADVWWMSPPVLPYVHAGLRRELDDARSNGILHVLDQVIAVKPRYVALECVPDFDKSLVRQKLLETLADCDYQWQETQLCPTELGVPNERRRYYLVAGRDELQPWKPLNPTSRFRLGSTLDESADDDLVIAPELLAMHRNTMHVVDPSEDSAVSSCFMSGYGRSVNNTGSYLRHALAVRYFSPTEILRQLAFPDSFTLPDSTSRATVWRMVGNSLSLPAARYILEAIPGLISRRSRFVRVTEEE
ncbi:MAG: DNA cytosine methyltransferase [Planctomycetes bacterium]|nr:DNA cytosine methyltransferase [Planctomycetota bacterium]